MTHPNPSTAMARAVVDELVVWGVRLVVVSPGSRSAALAIAAAEHPELRLRVVIDERSAAFHALGESKASGRPAAVVSTSGTAPANFFPAVVEADMACVPLVVVSADRPEELRGVGANQTIDQAELFGTKVRAFAELAAPDSASDLNAHWRGAAARLLQAARGRRPGPVHLNVAFREPTVPVSDDGRTRAPAYPHPTPRLHLASVPGTEETAEPFPIVLSADRGVVVAGDGAYDRSALLAQAGELGWPVLATALSGLRGAGVITSYHHLLAGGIPTHLRPVTVVAVGAIGPSPSLESLVGSATNRVRVDRWGRMIDPERNATVIHHGDPLELLGTVEGAADPRWALAWEDADRSCRGRLVAAITEWGAMTGAGVVHTLNRVEWGTLVAASSLPIREVDAHLTRGGRVHANRGASGIDGFVSTALGVAGVDDRVLALAGDLSLLHDSNGFLHDDSIDLTLVVIDNGGGGLFDSLPPARHAPHYERLFVTPPRRRLDTLASFHGLGYLRVETVDQLAEACNASLDGGGVTLVHVPVDRAADLAARAQLES